MHTDGIRSNLLKSRKWFYSENKFKQPIYDKRNAIVTTGDSFTAGNEVGNDETWPAILENISSKRVLNGGVGGYSIIQSVLLAEQIVNNTGIKKLIVSLIPDNLYRAENSILQGVPRPYFFKNNSQLTIKYNHIKQFKSLFDGDEIKSMNDSLKIFGRSFLVMEVLRRVYYKPDLFFYYGLNKKENISADIIGCKLMDRLNKFSSHNQTQIAILFQYADYYFYHKPDHQTRLNDYKLVIKCAMENDLIILDMYNEMNQIYQKNKTHFNQLFVGYGRHMSKLGNQFTAEFVKMKLSSIWF